MEKSCKECGIKVTFEIFNGECSDKEIARLVKIVEDKKFDGICGCGGGKPIDTAKMVANKA